MFILSLNKILQKSSNQAIKRYWKQVHLWMTRLWLANCKLVEEKISFYENRTHDYTNLILEYSHLNTCTDSKRGLFVLTDTESSKNHRKFNVSRETGSIAFWIIPLSTLCRTNWTYKTKTIKSTYQRSEACESDEMTWRGLEYFVNGRFVILDCNWFPSSTDYNLRAN